MAVMQGIGSPVGHRGGREGDLYSDLATGDTYSCTKDGSASTAVWQQSGGGTIVSGVYTPTLTNFTNIDASTPQQCQFMRIGSIVQVAGFCAVDATIVAFTELGISLPIPINNITQSAQLSGVMIDAASVGGTIAGDVNTDLAEAQWTPATTLNNLYRFMFMYEIQE